MAADPKVAFVHGRPGPHPFHAALARSVHSDFQYVDTILRWHDRNRPRPYRYLSMALCGAGLAFTKSYDVVISEGCHAVPIIARSLSFRRKRPIVIALMANETLFFLQNGVYSNATFRRLVRTLKSYDALICIGAFQLELAQKLLPDHRAFGPALFSVHSSLSDERLDSLANLEPSTDSQNLLFIGNGPSGWRAWYKGMDMLIEAFEIALAALPSLELTIVGEWDVAFRRSLLEKYPLVQGKVKFVGPTSDLSPHLSAASLYVHIARGEAFGISIVEAMRAGVPALVSEFTGAKEAVSRVDSRSVVKADPGEVATAIIEYFNSTKDYRNSLSKRSREIAGSYTFERSADEFTKVISSLCRSR